MTAFKAAYADWKLIKTRGVIQVVMEVPLAEADAAYDVLGGMPNAANEVWFGIAALNLPQAEKENSKLPAPATPEQDPKSARAKRDWRDVPYPQQAGIRINEPTFAAYLREEHPDEWHETGDADDCLKLICGVSSKVYLATIHKAALMWHQIDTDYAAWLVRERVGA